MDLLKISLLLFAAVSNVHSSIAKQSPKPWQPNTRKVNSFNDDLKNCICYPDGHLPTVHQLLDKQNNGQERLVVYLYKNDATNEIKMYIPNADKQMLIPDIPYEPGDGLTTVTTEYVYTLLYNNPNKIKVYNDHMETLIPAVTDSLPIGLNTGAIEHILPNTENYLNPNNAYKGNEYSLAKNTVVANGPNGEVVNRPQEGSSNILPVPYGYENLNILKQYGLTNNYPYTKPNNPQAISLIPITVPGNAQAVPEEPLAIPLNPQFPSYKPQVVSVNTQSLPPKQAFPENPQNSPSNPQAVPANPQAFPASYVGGLDQHVVYSFQTDQGLNKLSSDSKDIKVSHSTQYMTFNIWFKEQMKRFQNLHLPKDIKTIDNNMLRILVQKTLRENNIYVSVDGVITDAKGVVIDAANLELRPLLLGETFNYQILQNAQNAIKLPKHLPYLEGILVTLVSPPQILGIIPLGKTYLPETSNVAQSVAGLTSVNGSKIYVNSYGNAYSASPKLPYSLNVKEIYAEPTSYYAYSGANGVPTSQSSYSDTYNKGLAVAYPYTPGNVPQLGVSEVNYWSSGPYDTASKLPYPTANWNPSELSQPLGQRRKFSEAKIEHHYEPPVRTRKRGKGIKKLTKEEVVEVTTVEPFLSINASESGRRFPAPSLAGVMKTLLYLLNDLPSRRGLNSTGDVDILNEAEGNNDGGAPDFRIIGGNAATGSGTPLSNKGRSGSTENA